MVILLNISFLIALAAVIVFTRTAPPFRAFVYHNVLFSITLAIAASSFFTFLFRRQSLIIISLALVLLLKSGNTMYILNNGWQRAIKGYIQDDAFYTHLDQLTTYIIKQQPSQIFLDRQDHFLNF